MKLIDTHCHLARGRLIEDTRGVLDRSADAGVVAIICATSDMEEVIASAEFAQTYSANNVYCLSGIHPHDAINVSDEVLDHIEKFLKKPRCVGLGEIGLDYHYDYSPRDHQCRAFAEQLEIAKRCEMPIVIHTREAFDETMDIISASGVDGGKILFHSFTGGAEQAGRVLGIGASISYSGIATFKNADEIRSAVAITPADRIMIETDAPFLSPEPVRKMKTNEPANVAHVANHLAGLLNISPEQFARQTTENALRFFNIELKP